MLQGTTVVLTRPVDQARAAANLIEANGGRAILFPALEISPHTPEPDARAALERADVAIFISANAVEFGLLYVRGKLPDNLQLAAIGHATAQALKYHGYGNVIVPESGADSEALLATAALQAVQGKQLVIFRGVGGRETLRTVLCQRGAKLAYIECYTRRAPAVSASAVADLVHRDDIAAIHVLSRETLENFCTMIGPENTATLHQKVLFVPHLAVREAARILGFGDVTVTGFGDDGLIAALQQRFGP